MKAKVYMRIAKKKTGGSAYPNFKVAAGVRANYEPLTDSQGNALPTAAFALELEIPDSKIHEAAQTIAEIEIPEDQVQIAAEVTPV